MIFSLKISFLKQKKTVTVADFHRNRNSLKTYFADRGSGIPKFRGCHLWKSPPRSADKYGRRQMEGEERREIAATSHKNKRGLLRGPSIHR